jgi:hypothetical protein
VERISSWSMALGLSITFMELDIEIPYSRVRTMSIVFLLVEYKEVRLSIFKSYK